MQYRTVICVSHDTNSICTADEKLKPNDRRPCNTTCGQWLVSHWSDDVSIFRYGKTHDHSQSYLYNFLFFLLLKCTGSCNNATLTRRVWCSSSVCNQHERPLSTRRCILSTCTNGSIHKKLTTTSTTISTLKSTKAELNPGASRVTTTKVVTTSHKNTLTTTPAQKASLSTKTSTTIDKKTSATTTRLQKTSLLTQTNPKKTLATNPGRIQPINTTTKKVLTTQKTTTTTTTKKSSITTTVKTTTQQHKSTMKSPRRPG